MARVGMREGTGKWEDCGRLVTWSRDRALSWYEVSTA